MLLNRNRAIFSRSSFSRRLSIASTVLSTKIWSSSVLTITPTALFFCSETLSCVCTPLLSEISFSSSSNWTNFESFSFNTTSNIPPSKTVPASTIHFLRTEHISQISACSLTCFLPHLGR